MNQDSASNRQRSGIAALKPATQVSGANARDSTEWGDARMANRRWLYWVLLIGLLLAPELACSRDQPTLTVLTLPTATAPALTDTPKPARPTPVAVDATPNPVLPTLTATAIISGPTLTDVRFALEVDPAGELIFPASEFVSGVTRVYVRFAYSDFGKVTETEMAWYLNDNRVSASRLEWDGGEEGEYLVWIEDPNGLSRGQWRWDLLHQGAVVGGEAFVIGEAPRYVEDTWGIGFDPPATWTQVSDATDYVAFSSPDQLQGIALNVASNVTTLSELAAVDLDLFRVDHPEAEITLTEDVTMNGEPALLSKVRYEDPERGDQNLFIVSALHNELGYSLWVLGPADKASGLETLLAETLLSIQFAE